MSLYLVTFTISSSGKGDREELRKALIKRGSKHLFETTHLLANEEAKRLAEFCFQYMDEQTDSLLVIKVTNPKWGWLPKETWEWIDKHVDT
jgi:hypothetical protein